MCFAAGCSSSSVDSESELHSDIASAARRIDLPRKLDTLRVPIPFQFRATVECHDPIVGLRVEFTDNSQSLGEGDVLGSISIPARGTTEVEVDTLLTVPTLSAKTDDDTYGFILVEVYESTEFRAGFAPVIVLE